MDTKVSYPRRVGKKEATVRNERSSRASDDIMRYDFRYILRGFHEEEERISRAAECTFDLEHLLGSSSRISI
jgi:hypothetical protein